MSKIMNKILSIPYLFYAGILYWNLLDGIRVEIEVATQPFWDFDFALTFIGYLSFIASFVIIAIFATVALGIWREMKWAYFGGLMINILLPIFFVIEFLYEWITCEGLGCIGAGFILMFILPIVLIISVLTTLPLKFRWKRAKHNYINKYILVGVVIFILLHIMAVGFLEIWF